MFNSIGNLKHKAILFTAYSAGLRVSKVTALQIKHADSDRMQLLIKDAKGKKPAFKKTLVPMDYAIALPHISPKKG